MAEIRGYLSIDNVTKKREKLRKILHYQQKRPKILIINGAVMKQIIPLPSPPLLSVLSVRMQQGRKKGLLPADQLERGQEGDEHAKGYHPGCMEAGRVRQRPRSRRCSTTINDISCICASKGGFHLLEEHIVIFFG